MMRSIPKQPTRRPGPPAPAKEEPRQFQKLQASALYCPKCKQATPTREFLLLVLPDGNLYDYRCAYCGTSTGSRTEKQTPEVKLLQK
jgi:hypothetical protein